MELVGRNETENGRNGVDLAELVHSMSVPPHGVGWLVGEKGKGSGRGAA